MPASFTVEILDWIEAREFARPIRERVFIDEQRVPRGLEWDEWDASSEHAVARDLEGAAIGTARLLPDGRLGRMAVLSGWRGRGVGAQMLAALLGRARARGMAEVTLHAQRQAVGFYRRFGFSQRGEVFWEAGIAHVEMMLQLLSAQG
jgi:predicted GNAT family N-acyltransferase